MGNKIERARGIYIIQGYITRLQLINLVLRKSRFRLHRSHYLNYQIIEKKRDLCVHASDGELGLRPRIKLRLSESYNLEMIGNNQ